MQSNLISTSMTYMSLVVVLGVLICNFPFVTFDKNVYMSFLMIFSVFVFFTLNLLILYVFFELSLVPVFMMVFYSGYQPERVKAALYLLMYTVVSSLFFLGYVLLSMKTASSGLVSELWLHEVELTVFQGVISLLLLFPFLVKLPIFGLHFWLPLAHVQSPTEGSMVLAAILLKLGGVGLIKLLPMVDFSDKWASGFLVTWGVWGSFLSACLCIISQDMKTLVAMSSVVHMGLGVSCVFSKSVLGLYSFVLMLISHGFSSGAMFLLVGEIYLHTSSRSMLYFVNFFHLLPVMGLWGFLTIIANMGVPPSLNFMAELLSAFVLSSMSCLALIFLMLVLLVAVSYSVLLYSQIFHGATKNFTPLHGVVSYGVNSGFGLFTFMYLTSVFAFIGEVVCN